MSRRHPPRSSTDCDPIKRRIVHPEEPQEGEDEYNHLSVHVVDVVGHVDVVCAVVLSGGAVARFVVDVGVVVVFSEIQFQVGDWLVVLPR